MAYKQRKFADDGWAIWINGDDVSDVFINDWLNPKGQSYVDIAISINGIKDSKCLNVYVPFLINQEEITDISLLFQDRSILQATFSASCIFDYMKNEKTSEIAFNGKTIDIVHISKCEYEVVLLSEGSLLKIDLEKIHPYLDNNEAYFTWRMPHKSLNDIFLSKSDVGSLVNKFRDLITTPVVSEKYGYSIRINESRLLPEEITKIGSFHRQKIEKTVVTISIDESYDINDGNCYQIRRLEEKLYKDFMPKDYNCENIISYQWIQNREQDGKGLTNFYYNITKNYVSKISMLLYLVLLTVIGVFGDLIAGVVSKLIGQ